MFRPFPMKHVRLLTLTEDLPQASLTLAETESFHPDTREPAEAGLPNQPGREYRDTYLQARSRLSKISKLIPGEEVPKNARVRVIGHSANPSSRSATIFASVSIQWSETFSERLAEARSSLLLAEPFVALDPSIRSAGHLAVLAGWVPKHEVSRLEQRLRESLAFSFYLSLVWGGLNLARAGQFGMLPMLLVITTLGALAWYGWRQMEAPLSEKILVVFIETLETVIGYTSNTLSFLRVAAFSLNHVALSIAVFTLADMMGAFGHVITVILGNLFVLVLEGGIVMIQVMRLEFYEGFARYFSGDGHKFAPLRLRRGGAAGHNTEA